jgi:hypothetical protein
MTRWILIASLAGCALGAPAPQPAAPAAAVAPGDLTPFESGDGTYGYRGPDGATVLPARYGFAGPFSTEGVAAVFDDGAWWWIDASGARKLKAYPFDNGADPHVDGLARYLGDDGKVGFADLSARVVIPARFTWVTAFNEGYAAFCEGCAPVAHGEHTAYEGGRWGLIGATGVEVVAGRYDAIQGWSATRATATLDGAAVDVPL